MLPCAAHRLLHRSRRLSALPLLSACMISRTHTQSNRPTSIRNVGILAHIDAGKTTTTENMLYLAGEIKAVGRVDSGDTVTDFLPQERERGITINSAIIELRWNNCLVNVIDTPGHVDFTIEVERSCRVLDGVVLVVDAVAGVQAQTKTVWRQARKQAIPAVAFINKMDRDGASFTRAVKSLKESLGIAAIAIQLPVLSADGDFAGVVDLISMTSLLWNTPITPNTSARNTPPPAPSSEPVGVDHSLRTVAMAARRVMLEELAEVDERFLDLFLANEATLDDLSSSEVLHAIKRACLCGAAVPTVCGASLKGKGIQPLLNCIVSFLPSPDERPPVIARLTKTGELISIASSSDSLAALAFKVSYDPARGPLVYVRVYSGSLEARAIVYNSTRDVRERVGQILRVNADELEPITSLEAGEVGCIVGLKKTLSGDTLVLEGGPLGRFVLDGLSIPKSVFALAIEPERSSQQDDLEQALNILCMEDPSLVVDANKESGQMLIRGLGELHLEIVCDKLRRQFGIAVSTGRAYVAFRETLALEGSEEMDFEYDKTIGTKRLYAHMTFRVTHAPGKHSPVLEYKAIANSLSVDEKNSLQEAFDAGTSRGPAGYPVVGFDVEVMSLERNAHTDSGAVRACVAMFLSQLLRGPLKSLLQPMMSVELYVPTKFVGEVLSDLSATRRGIVKEVRNEGVSSVVLGTVPLVTMLGYASSIRSMTQGEGSFSLEYLDHAVVEEMT